MNLFKTLPELSAEEKKNAKKHLFFAVRFWCAMSEKSRREGLLSLEDVLTDGKITLPDGKRAFPPAKDAESEYADIEEWIFSRLIRLLCDGIDENFVVFVARYSLCNLEKHLPPATLLSLLMGVQAIVNIHRGESVLYTRYQLLAMLGHELCEEFLLNPLPPLELSSPAYQVKIEHTPEELEAFLKKEDELINGKPPTKDEEENDEPDETDEADDEL